jgi:hypothetical protein
MTTLSNRGSTGDRPLPQVADGLEIDIRQRALMTASLFVSSHWCAFVTSLTVSKKSCTM